MYIKSVLKNDVSLFIGVPSTVNALDTLLFWENVIQQRLVVFVFHFSSSLLTSFSLYSLNMFFGTYVA